MSADCWKILEKNISYHISQQNSGKTDFKSVKLRFFNKHKFLAKSHLRLLWKLPISFRYLLEQNLGLAQYGFESSPLTFFEFFHRNFDSKVRIEYGNRKGVAIIPKFSRVLFGNRAVIGRFCYQCMQTWVGISHNIFFGFYSMFIPSLDYEFLLGFPYNTHAFVGDLPDILHSFIQSINSRTVLTRKFFLCAIKIRI